MNNLGTLQRLVDADIVDDRTANSMRACGLSLRQLHAVYKRFGDQGLKLLFNAKRKGKPWIKCAPNQMEDVVQELSEFLDTVSTGGL